MVTPKKRLYSPSPSKTAYSYNPTYREFFLCSRAGVLVRVDIEGDGTVGLLDVGFVGSSLQSQDRIALIVAAKDIVRVFETAR